MVEDPKFYQQTATTWWQVDQTLPMSSILAHVYFQGSYNNLNQLVNSMIDLFSEEVKGVQYHLMVRLYQGSQFLLRIWKLMIVFYFFPFLIEGVRASPSNRDHLIKIRIILKKDSEYLFQSCW